MSAESMRQLIEALNSSERPKKRKMDKFRQPAQIICDQPDPTIRRDQANKMATYFEIIFGDDFDKII